MRGDPFEVGLGTDQHPAGIGDIVGRGHDLQAVALARRGGHRQVVLDGSLQQLAVGLRLEQQRHQRAFVAQQVTHVGETVAQVQHDGLAIAKSFQRALDRGKPIAVPAGRETSSRDDV